jgi:hypothetical protein
MLLPIELIIARSRGNDAWLLGRRQCISLVVMAGTFRGRARDGEQNQEQESGYEKMGLKPQEKTKFTL